MLGLSKPQNTAAQRMCYCGMMIPMLDESPRVPVDQRPYSAPVSRELSKHNREALDNLIDKGIDIPNGAHLVHYHSCEMILCRPLHHLAGITMFMHLRKCSSLGFSSSPWVGSPGLSRTLPPRFVACESSSLYCTGIPDIKSLKKFQSMILGRHKNRLSPSEVLLILEVIPSACD